MIRRLVPYVLAVFFLSSVACGGAVPREDRALYEVPTSTNAASALSMWFAGNQDQAQQVLEARDARTPEDLYFEADIAYWRGDVESAFQGYVALLQKNPGHPLARYAAAHLYSIRNSVIDFEDRVEPLFAKIDYAELAPLTRLYLSMTAQTVGHRQWSVSDDPSPFDAAAYGFPSKWLKTPMISAWRLRDLDHGFAAETAPRLASTYLSPAVAEDVELNYEETTPYMTGGISLYPGFGRNGLYYLETWATVPDGPPREFWLYGNFVGAAKVWIDGELAMSREEGDYSPGKRLRKIRLTSGKHRVLVKMAYQAGFRDWFDLSFIPAGARAVNRAEIDFSPGCLPDRKLPDCLGEDVVARGEVEFLSEARHPVDYEPVLVQPDQVDEASEVALYLTMVGTFFDGEAEIFAAAWEELSRRRPKFAAGHGLVSEQVQTLWQVQSRLRDARALQELRTARKLDPSSVRFLESLGAWLKKRDGEREAREVLEEAKQKAVVERDGQKDRVLDIGPLLQWADWLGDRGWEEQAEKAWERVLELAPSNCRAAGKLQSLYYARSNFLKPAEITPEHEECPRLNETFLNYRDELVEERIELARREASRLPLNASRQRRLARELYRADRPDEARAVLRQALERIPDEMTLWNELAERELTHEGVDAAIRVYEQAAGKNGNRSWLVWKLANLREKIPLQNLMPDGYQAAMEAVGASKDLGEGAPSLSKDDAYFVIDFAARHYYPDNSAITLTHTVTRVMTKNAIDRYGETSIPGGAQVLLARTIKKDGTVLVPEQTAGKATLSMPGLAEGDFVEIAYLQYASHSVPPSQIEGVRFFFRMQNISTLHSEYVILGEKAEFMRRNDAPAMEEFTHDGVPAVRFLAKNNPRPRSEPRTVSVEEFLPWIQMYRDGTTIGDFESERRDRFEQIRDSLKWSEQFRAQVREWLDVPEERMLGRHGVPDREYVKELFYRVAGFFPDPSMSSWGTDVSHAILTKEGNPTLVLKALFDAAGIPAEIYLVKSKYQLPEALPIREFEKYRNAVLMTTIPDTEEVVWLYPDGPDAMFAAAGPAIHGQPAICVSCEEPTRATVDASSFRSNRQSIEVTGKLDEGGNLAGTARYVFRGVSAFQMRKGLRARTDETSRGKLMDSLVSGVISAGTAAEYRIENEKKPDEDLIFEIDFTRSDFARETSPGQFQIETRLFREAIASAYAPLAERTTPMMISYERDNDYRLTLDVSAFQEAQLMSGQAPVDLDSAFGSFDRKTTLTDGKLVITSEIQMPIQRVPVAEYKAFQGWAIAVEQSSVVFLTLR